MVYILMVVIDKYQGSYFWLLGITSGVYLNEKPASLIGQIECRRNPNISLECKKA